MAAQRSSTRRAWVVYSLLRLLFFAAPLTVVWLVSGNVVLSAVVAAVIGLCLSVVLLDGQRGRVAVQVQSWAERRHPSSDEAVEDRAVDGAEDRAAADAGQTNASAAPRPRP